MSERQMARNGRPMEEAIGTLRIEAQQALQIWEGAVNAVPISRALASAIAAGFNVSSTNAREALQLHPAYAPSRLIAHQLMFIMGANADYPGPIAASLTDLAVCKCLVSERRLLEEKDIAAWATAEMQREVASQRTA